MRCFLLILVLISLNSCFLSKPRRADKKIQKAMKLHPERFKVDTLYIRDTILVESFRVDTVKEMIYHDTVTVINNDKVSLKYFYDTTRLEIWHEVECHGYTVYLTHEVVVDKLVESSDNRNFLPWVLIVFLGFLTIALTLALMKRYK